MTVATIRSVQEFFDTPMQAVYSESVDAESLILIQEYTSNMCNTTDCSDTTVPDESGQATHKVKLTKIEESTSDHSLTDMKAASDTFRQGASHIEPLGSVCEESTSKECLETYCGPDKGSSLLGGNNAGVQLVHSQAYDDCKLAGNLNNSELDEHKLVHHLWATTAVNEIHQEAVVDTQGLFSAETRSKVTQNNNGIQQVGDSVKSRKEINNDAMLSESPNIQVPVSRVTNGMQYELLNRASTEACDDKCLINTASGRLVEEREDVSATELHVGKLEDGCTDCMCSHSYLEANTSSVDTGYSQDQGISSSERPDSNQSSAELSAPSAIQCDPAGHPQDDILSSMGEEMEHLLIQQEKGVTEAKIIVHVSEEESPAGRKSFNKVGQQAPSEDSCGESEQVSVETTLAVVDSTLGSGSEGDPSFKLSKLSTGCKEVKCEEKSEEQDFSGSSKELGLPPTSKHSHASPRSLGALLSSGNAQPSNKGESQCAAQVQTKDTEVNATYLELVPSVGNLVNGDNNVQQDAHNFPEKWYGHEEHDDFTSATFSGPIAFSGSIAYSGVIAYSGPIPHSGSISHRSDSSTSTRSFAFPILASDWNSSPVKMAQPDSRYFRRRRRWNSCFCCKRPSTLFD